MWGRFDSCGSSPGYLVDWMMNGRCGAGRVDEVGGLAPESLVFFRSIIAALDAILHAQSEETA